MMKKLLQKAIFILFLISLMNVTKAQVLAYDDFNVPLGSETRVPLLDASSGSGWAAGWSIQNASATIPGYNISSQLPLTYSSLKSDANYGTGGDSYLGAGRGLNISGTSPFADYLEGAAIGKAGTTLWVSALLRNENYDYKFGLKNGGTSSSGSQLLMIAKVNSNWGLKGTLITTDLESSVACVDNEVILAVLKLEFGASSTDVSLYINPTDLGGDAPTVATLTTTTNAALLFTGVRFYPGSGANNGSVDEIRFGATYADVTPIPLPTIDDIASPITIMDDAGLQTINLTGIGDGVDGTNTISISATSSNTSVIPNPSVVYTTPEATGSLTFTPASPGTTTITLTISSSAVATDKIIAFDVEVLNGAINNPPTIDEINDRSVANTVNTQTVLLSGIDDGDQNKIQALSVTAISSNQSVIANGDIAVNYTSDNSSGSINYDISGTEGTTTITVTVQDDGGTANGAEDTKTISFTVTVVDAAGIGWMDDFEDNTLTGWASNNYYALSEESGQLETYAVTKQIWQNYTVTLPSSIDISANPYVNLNMKLVNNSEPFLHTVYLFDGSGSNANTNVKVLPSENYQTLFLDFTGKGVDLTDIVRIGFCYNGYAGDYKGYTSFEEIKIGAFAEKLCNMGNVIDQSFPIGKTEGKILFTDLQNVASLNITGADALIENISFSPITTGGFMESRGLSTMSFDIKSGVSGSALVTVAGKGVSGYADNQVQFTLTIEENMPPAINPISNYDVPAGKGFTIPLSGIDDGNPAFNQSIIFTGSSNASAVITGYNVEHKKGSPYGTLSFIPVSAQENIDVSLTLTDDGATNNSTVTNFTINSYNNFNYRPTAENIEKQVILLSDGQQTITLSGINDGDGGSQALSLSASSNNTGVLSDPTINYTNGESTATITLDPQAYGIATVTISISDDGDNSSNNGNQTYQSIFEVEVLPAPVLGYTYPFTTGTTASDWNPEGGFSGLTYVDFDGYSDVMKIDFNNKWTYAGLWSTLPEVLDLRDNPYVSMFVYPVNDDMEIVSWLYDENSERNSQLNKPVTANTWNHVFYDFRGDGLLNSSSGEPIDAQKITSLLINLHDELTWPFTDFSGTIYIRALKLGDQADIPAFTPTCSINPIASQVHLYDAAANEVTINLSNITNGDGNSDNISITASGTNNSVANPSVSTVANDGTATLTYTPGAIGTTDITVSVSTSGSNDSTVVFSVEVIADNPTNAIDINVDLSTTFQTIKGLGAFKPDPHIKPELWAKEMGASAMRLGLVNNQIEPLNDNNDPYVLDRSKLNYDVFDWEWIKEYKENGVETFILTSWSPPAWMKDNLATISQAGSVVTENTTNRLSFHYYQEFAESMIAIITLFEEEAGIHLEAIGLQNEPVFYEPYPSGILDKTYFTELIKVVGERFAQEGITTRLMMPEDVAYNDNNRAATFLDVLQADPIADQYCDIFAIHGYSSDGIQAGEPDFSQWINFYNNAQEGTNPKELWMTETSRGHPNMDEMLKTAGTIIGALEYGKISLWTAWWYGQYLDKKGNPTIGLWGNKQFFYHIRPGAVKVQTNEIDVDILSTTFINNPENGSNLVTVLVNKSNVTKTAKLNITGGTAPTVYDAFQTREYAFHETIAQGAALGDVITIPANSITTIVGYGAVYDLNVTSGSGSGQHAEGAEVTITANEPPIGEIFDAWTGDVQYIANANMATTTLSMPAQAVNISATYKPLAKYTLTVNKGTGDGDYVEGAVVSIAADDSTSLNRLFVGWTGDIQYLANPSDSATTVTMPAQAINVSASYQDAATVVKYTLTVNSGSGSGSYIEGASVNIVANAPATDYVFSQWSGDISLLSDITASSARITMPASNAILTAEYVAETKYTLTLTGGIIQGTSGDTTGMYSEGATATIVANPGPAGSVFAGWIGDISALSNASNATTQVTIGTSDISLEATYSTVQTYALNVIYPDGEVNSQRAEGAAINIAANTYLRKYFVEWIGDLSVIGASATSKVLSFTMPAQELNFEAVYVDSLAKVSIIVVDINGNPFEGAIVTLEEYPDSTWITGADGKVILYVPRTISATTRYLLNISAEGYDSWNRLTLSIDSWEYESIAIPLSPTGIEQIYNSKEMLVYPNPANDIINIQLNAGRDIQTISIYSLLGKLVLEVAPNTSGLVSISVNDLPKGIYILNTRAGNTVYINRIIIQ